jgi:hypothetical protein
MKNKNTTKSNNNNNNNNNNRLPRTSRNSFLSGKLKQRTAPPPVIALSRSSFSTNTNSSTSSSLEATEVNGFEPPSSCYYRNHRRGITITPDERHCHGHYHGHGHGNSQDLSMFPNTSYDRNYEAQHEQLINSLFEDAKRRQELLIQEEILDQTLGVGVSITNTNTGSSGGDDPESSPNSNTNTNTNSAAYNTPPRRKSIHNTASTSTSAASDKSVTSRTSRHSRTSHSTRSSELLTPSSHRFQPTLSPRGVLPRFRRRMNFNKFKRNEGNSNGHSNNGHCNLKNSHKSTSKDKGTHVHSHGHDHRHSQLNNMSPNQSDFSACSGSMSMTTSSPCVAAPTVQSFLDKNVQLQKDVGKGSEIGTIISAKGREEAISKLNDKMDVLAEVERDGKWAHATLTRIPAKDVTRERRELGLDQPGYVETRSMLAVKVGFVSLKYGVLVHWNVQTGLAEFVLLRKSCPESFMRVAPSSGKKGNKTWRKKMKRMSDAATKMNDNRFHATPSFVTVSSVQSDDSYGTLGLDPVMSSPM